MQFKFRAWDIENNHMLSWEEIQDEWISEGYFHSIFEQDHYDTMQFTGVTDDILLPIYQGDIVKLIFSNWFAEENEIDSAIGVVEFENGAFIVRIESVDFTPAISNSFTKSIKILGNAYENPELIEVK